MTGNQTNRMLRSFILPLLLGVGLVAPFLILQLVNRRAFNEEFPLVLFAFMTVHAMLIAFCVVPALRLLVTERTLKALTFRHWAGPLIGIFLGYVYVTVIIDQMPCFLGVPNCD